MPRRASAATSTTCSRAAARSGCCSGACPSTLYAELPYCVTHGWPAWVGAPGPRGTGDVDAYWQAYLTDVPEMPPLREARVAHLDAEAAGVKLQAIGCYELSLGLAAREALAAGAFHTAEVMWDLVPAEHAAG